MRRRRQWLEDIALSPTSRRRLDNSPSGDIVSQFGRALDSVNITLELPPRIIDLTSDADVEEEVRDIMESGTDEQQEEEELVQETADTSMNVDDTIARTVAQAYNELLAQISPPRTPSPPLPPPPPPQPQNVVNLYRTPPRRQTLLERPSSSFHSSAAPSDTMVLRIRSRRDPQLVVRLPSGGFSYASNPSYSYSPVSSPRRTRSLGWRSNPVAPPPRRHQRIQRIRRQLRMDLENRSRMEIAPARNRSPAMLWSTLASSLRANPGGVLRSQPQRSAPRRHIPSFVATEEMGVPEGKCGICLEEFKVGTRISIIPCQPEGVSGAKDHVFCHECIRQWVSACRGERTCPLCRGAW